MEFRIAVVILAVGILVSISVTFLIFLFLNTPEVVEVRMQYNVSNLMGFNIDTSALYYGTIPPRGSGSRDLLIENQDGYSKNVALRFFGESAPWTYTENASFVLGPHERVSVPIIVRVPENAAFGSYSGLVRIYLTKA